MLVVTAQTALEPICPYCEVRQADSRDHVFPKFLAGRRTIPACKQCNNTFGHTFEAGVASDLTPVIIMLRRAGLKSARNVVWRRAYKDPNTGVEYDLDSDLRMYPSRPVLERDDAGRIKNAMFATRTAAQRLIRGLNPLKYRLTEHALPELKLGSQTFNLKIGTELRRLSMKMSVAVAEITGHGKGILDSRSRSFLLSAAAGEVPVKMDFTRYDALNSRRPPLAHMVFVKGNSKTGRCYGIVQFYGTIQLYAILNERSYQEPDFSSLGTLSPISGDETFGNTDLLEYPEPPTHLASHLYSEGLKSWATDLSKHAAAALVKDKLTVQIATD